MRLVLGLVSAAALFAQPSAMEIPWSESAEALAGLYVTLELTSGTRLEGYWAGVEDDRFRFQVARTSNKDAVAKGLQTLDRASIAAAKAGKRRTRGRWIGTLASYFVCGGIAGESLQGPAFFGCLAAGTAGYFVGRSFDHATRPIVFVRNP